ncbi:hypothetical protein A3H85_01005 [Candidatus Daviesbacteria bacterium RIFCSPLOWO2_02_FULL_40_8]|nr:MAG: hypothetical protein A3H85_01005 [Candidatus Daviesbacteria bacterium RIFCSPLOWO2_02_FULL_40_8]
MTAIHPSSEPVCNPKITVIVRARNEESNIVATLNSLNKQNFQGFQIVIVDNGSTDNTKKVISDFLSVNLRFQARSIEEQEIGRGKALHTGVLAANTEWIACLDSDTVAAPNWLETICGFISRNPRLVAGSGQIQFLDGPKHHKLLYSMGRGIIYSLAARNGQGWLSLANSWFRKSVFLASGGTRNYPENVIPDDRILALQLRKHGKIGFCEEAKVWTENWLTRKPQWLTHFWNELEQVREVAGTKKPSFFQNIIRPISELCRLFDDIKERTLHDTLSLRARGGFH